MSENATITADPPEPEGFQSLAADDEKNMGLDSPGPPGGSIAAHGSADEPSMTEAAVHEVRNRPADAGDASKLPVEAATTVTADSPNHPEEATPA